MVAMRRRPVPARRHRRVADADVGDPALVPERLVACDDRDAGLDQLLGHGVAGMSGDQQHAGGDGPRYAPPLGLVAGEHQQQRDVVRGERLGAAHQGGATGL
jgi:hypothetical protein